jgi:hypothetical protein
VQISLQGSIERATFSSSCVMFDKLQIQNSLHEP